MKIELELPNWLAQINSQPPQPAYQTVESRAELVIQLSRLNVEYNTGGPFAAAIFNRDTGALLTAGANLVVPLNCSIAHAEIVAIMLAHQTLETYRLSGHSPYQLVSSCEPCAMCMGAIPWCHIDSLVCCARDSDARAIGFDEGDKPDNWVEKYQTRQIEVIRDILRPQARQVLNDYARNSGHLY